MLSGNKKILNIEVKKRRYKYNHTAGFQKIKLKSSLKK